MQFAIVSRLPPASLQYMQQRFIANRIIRSNVGHRASLSCSRAFDFQAILYNICVDVKKKLNGLFMSCNTPNRRMSYVQNYSEWIMLEICWVQLNRSQCTHRRLVYHQINSFKMVNSQIKHEMMCKYSLLLSSCFFLLFVEAITALCFDTN